MRPRRHQETLLTEAFERYSEDADLAPLMKGLVDDQCQSPHWGYVLSGKATFHATSDEETFDAGDSPLQNFERHIAAGEQHGQVVLRPIRLQDLTGSVVEQCPLQGCTRCPVVGSDRFPDHSPVPPGSGDDSPMSRLGGIE